MKTSEKKEIYKHINSKISQVNKDFDKECEHLASTNV